MMLLILLFVLFLIGYYFLGFNSRKSKYHLPPGPPRFPLIGSLLSLLMADGKRPAVAFELLGKKYGPVFSLKLGSTETVVLNSHAVMMEVADSEDLLSHVDESDIWTLEKGGSLPIGLFNALPDLWAETRTFCKKTLRKHGFNTKSRITPLIIDELAEFSDELKSQMTNGQIRLTMKDQFNHLFLNIIWTIVTGKKYQTSDPNTRRLLEAIMLFMRANTFGGNIASIYPQLAKAFPKLSGFSDMQILCSQWRSIIKEAVAEHRLEGTYKSSPINFLDEFLHKIDSVEKPQNILKSVFTEDNLVGVLQDFGIAGTDTQANIMKLLIRYILKNPEIQTKLQNEVDDIVGHSRLVMEDDVPRLVYTQATMYELHRLGSAVPVAPRRLLNDWKFREYEIPKGSLIMLNIWAGSRDAQVWKNPTVFDPTRFLSPESTLINTEKILSFGFGKRRCIGEPLAKSNIVLATATLIQNFSFHLDPESGMPSDGDVHGLTRDIDPFNVIIKARNN